MPFEGIVEASARFDGRERGEEGCVCMYVRELTDVYILNVNVKVSALRS